MLSTWEVPSTILEEESSSIESAVLSTSSEWYFMTSVPANPPLPPIPAPRGVGVDPVASMMMPAAGTLAPSLEAAPRPFGGVRCTAERGEELGVRAKLIGVGVTTCRSNRFWHIVRILILRKGFPKRSQNARSVGDQSRSINVIGCCLKAIASEVFFLSGKPKHVSPETSLSDVS